MSEKLVKFTRCDGPICGEDVLLPADVVICVLPEKKSSQTFPGFILGSLVYQCKGSCEWTYTISYDDAQLIPNYSLVGGDILGIVCGCLGGILTDLATGNATCGGGEVVNGRVVVCDGEGNSKILNAPEGSPGDVLTLIDPITGDASYQPGGGGGIPPFVQFDTILSPVGGIGSQAIIAVNHNQGVFARSAEVALLLSTGEYKAIDNLYPELPYYYGWSYQDTHTLAFNTINTMYIAIFALTRESEGGPAGAPKDIRTTVYF